MTTNESGMKVTGEIGVHMTKQSLASLALKLMAIYVIVSFFPVLPMCLGTIYMLVKSPSILVSFALVGSTFLLLAVWLGLGIAFIRFADGIARLLVPNDEGIEVISVSNEDALYKVVFVCFGLIATVKALPHLTVHVATLWFIIEKYSHMEAARSINYRDIGYFIGYAIQFGLGILLMIRPGVVLAWIKKFQH